MKEREDRFQSAAGLDLFCRQWMPMTGPVRGIVFILHGLSEHGGRYRHVAAALTAAGFACYAPDHRGHGKSGGTRAYIADGRLVIDDLNELYRRARAAQAGSWSRC